MKTIHITLLVFILLVPSLLFAQDSFDVKEDEYKAAKKIALDDFEQGHYKKAIYGFSKLIKEKRDDYELIGKRGIAFLWNGQPQMALNDLNTAIAKAPKAIYFFYRAGLLAYDDTKGKIADYDKAIALDAGNARYFYERATLKLRVFREYVYSKSLDERLRLYELEKKLGFSLSICQDFNKASRLDKKYTHKSTVHCEAFTELKYYHVHQ